MELVANSINPVQRAINKAIRYLILTSTLFVSFRVLTKSPFESFALQLELLFIAFLLVFSLFYFADLILKRKSPHAIELLVFLYAMSPVYSGIMANIEFGQPVVFGILAQRKMFLILTAIFVYYLLKTGFISIDDVKKAFLFLIWFEFFFNILLVAVLNPQQHLATVYIVSNPAKGGILYRFDVVLIVLGIIYYFIRFLSAFKIKHLLFTVLFLLYIFIFHKGRGLIVCFAAVLVLYYIMNVSLKEKMNFFLIFSFISIVAIGLTQLINPGFISDYTLSFKNVFTVLTGGETGEPSADSRIIQLETALKHLGGDWQRVLFGSGKISNQWNEGYKGVLGYLYPSDIGLLGVVLVFGLAGLVVFKLQYVFFIRLWRKKVFRDIEPGNNAQFMLVLKYFIFYLFIHSFQTGEDSFEIQKNLVILVIFWGYARFYQAPHVNIAATDE